MKKEIYEYSLNEILAIKDEIEKRVLLQKFEKEKEEMFWDRVMKRYAEKKFQPNLSLLENYYQIELICQEFESQFLFPGHTVILYPKVTEHVARKRLEMHLGPFFIEAGETYYMYRPLLEDITSRKKYVLKDSLRSTLDYLDDFPQNFREFEEWDYNLQHAYYNSDNSKKVDFYELSCRLKNDGLKLLLLHDDVLTRKKRRLNKKLQKLHDKERELHKNSLIEPEQINLITSQISKVEEELFSLKLKK